MNTDSIENSHHEPLPLDIFPDLPEKCRLEPRRVTRPTHPKRPRLRLIARRINTIGALDRVPSGYGAEVDLRDDPHGGIYTQRGPFSLGENFWHFMSRYSKHRRGPLILNVKSERVELPALVALEEYGIKNYFFLDCTFPMLELLSNLGVHNVGIRLSEFAPIEFARLMAGRATWICADTKVSQTIDLSTVTELRSLGYKICLSSPDSLEAFTAHLAEEDIIPDAILCDAASLPRS